MNGDRLLSDKNIADKLRKVAAKSPCRNRHAAILLDSADRVICWGYNRGGFRFSLHAEVDAITKWLRAYRPRGRRAATIVVARVSRRGEFLGSKPCQQCEALIRAVNLNVVHT